MRLYFNYSCSITSTSMDLFEIPDDYKPEKPLSTEEMDEITNYLKGHPLFLKEMPENIEGNEVLMAIQALKEEEDPQVTAQNLNKQANARLLQGPNSPYYLKDAYEKYTQAIKLKCENQQLNAKLHANRAAINLKFKNYGKVIEDCKIAIKYSPDYLKAYYRMGKALIALKRFQECLDLLKEQKDGDLVALRKEAEQHRAKEKAQVEKVQQKKSQYASQVEAYFKEKKWILGKQNEQLPEGVSIQFFDGKISIPILIIYPEFRQFDLIAKTHENQKISECIQQLFQSPLPWDTKNEYNPNSIEVYFQIEEAVLVRLPNQATIIELASRKAVNGAIQIMVTTKNQFFQHFRQQYKIY